MIENLIEKLSNDWSFELVILFAGSVIIYLLQKGYFWAKDLVFRRNLKKELKSYQKRKDIINVVDLANGDPEFKKENIFAKEVSIFGKERSLYINMDERCYENLVKKELSAGYPESHLTKFHDDRSLDGSTDFSELAEITKIANLGELIEKHRKIVSDLFLRSENGLIFNGDKYGVFNLRFMRFGNEERPGVELELFKTDYFTHRVFRSIYHELKQLNHPVISAGINDFLQYKPFFTSFGINTLLICEGEKGKEIVLSKRSARVHGNIARYHITMNEGLSQMDKDPFGKVDLELCFKRGLLEELGINDKLYNFGTKVAFYDFFLEKNNFEIGLTSVFEIDLNYKKDLEPLIARDRALESDSFVTLPLNSKVISNFVKNSEFVPHGLYVLDRVLMRECITLASLYGESKRRL